MTLTTQDAAGVRRGVQDRLIHLVAGYPGYFSPHDLRHLEPLHGADTLPWEELDRLRDLINLWIRTGLEPRRRAA